MGMENNGIRKNAIGALARKTIKKGFFNTFAQDVSRDFSTQGLDKLASNIKSSRENRTNDEPTL